MASTSGTYTFNPAADKIIRGSLRLLGVIAEGETPNADIAQDALDSLNGMVKGWQASGIHLWAEQDATLYLQAGQNSYQLGPDGVDFSAVTSATVLTTSLNAIATNGTTVTMSPLVDMHVGDAIGIWLLSGVTYWTTISALAGAVITLTAGVPSAVAADALVTAYGPNGVLQRPLRVMAARRYTYSGALETPMSALSRIDYAAMPNKSNTGTITQWFYDPLMNNGYGTSLASSFGTMHVWPTPADNLSAMRFTSQRPLMDVNSMANVLDFPQEWISTIRFNLAVELAAEFDVPADRLGVLKVIAKEKFDMSAGWDREPESTYFGAAMQPGGYR